jgi:hypothetical protein
LLSLLGRMPLASSLACTSCIAPCLRSYPRLPVSERCIVLLWLWSS